MYDDYEKEHALTIGRMANVLKNGLAALAKTIACAAGFFVGLIGLVATILVAREVNAWWYGTNRRKRK